MKIHRLLGIIITLLQKEKVTAPYLAEKFEVSRRTINRDIEEISKAGIPIYTQQGVNGGISILEDYKIDKTLFSKSELKDTFTGLLSLDSVSENKRYNKIIEKFAGENNSIISSNHMMIDLSSHYKDTLAPKIDLIEKAIENYKIIEFDYYNKNGEHHIKLNPYIIVFRWSSWYVLGEKDEREEFRLYKLNRLWNLKITEKEFKVIDIPEETLNFDRYFTDEINVKILFNEKVKYRLIEDYGVESFRVTSDGKLYFQFPFTNEDYLLEWVLSFGENAELIEPANLKRKLKDKLENMIKYYKQDK